LLKPEITQTVKLVHSLNTHQDVTAERSPKTIPGQPSGLAKLASESGNRRNRTLVMLGLAISMGISSFSTTHSNAIATAAPESSNPNTSTATQVDRSNVSADFYVGQIRSDISTARAQHQQSAEVRIAQAIPNSPIPLSVANRTNNLQYSGEPTISIDVPAPKSKTFKSVPSTQAYNATGAEGELYHPGDVPSRTGETTIGFSWPAAGTLTSRFGRRWGRMHKGIDIAGPIGTPINAAADGTVVFAGWSSGGYGNLVEVRHNDGTTTRYGHNSRLSVNVGQSVRQGQQVAEMGSTGHSTGSHLHFEIRPNGGDAVNPIAHLPSSNG
jgi:murein DD-endopeptidase MepM/ murein hydrolase activator NlpD